MLSALITVLAACASVPPPPPNAAPPLTLAERAGGAQGVRYGDVIEATEPATLAGGAVQDGGVLISFPFRYRHTAVLTENVVGFSITVSGVQAPAGSPGYYAGTFAGGPRGQTADLWCFLPRVAGGERENLCLLRTSPSLAAIAPTRLNPYIWSQFAPATGTFDYVNAPVFERRDVEIPVNLVFEYRFERWRGDTLHFVEYAGGQRAHEWMFPRNAEGFVLLRTVAGDFRVAPSPDNPEWAVVTPAE